MKFTAFIRDNDELPHVLRVCETREDAEQAIEDCIGKMTDPNVAGPYWTWVQETE